MVTPKSVELICFLDDIQNIIKEYTVGDTIYNYRFDPEYECDLDDLYFSLQHRCEKLNNELNKGFISFSYRKSSSSDTISYSIIQLSDCAVIFEIIIPAENKVIDLSDMSIKTLEEMGYDEEEENE